MKTSPLFRTAARLLAFVVALIAMMTQSGLAANYSDAVMADGPIAYWRFNDTPPTAINSGTLGAAAAGTYNATAAPGSEAPKPPAFAGFEDGNTAAQFDGTGHVSTGNSLINSRPVFSVTSWIRRNGNQLDRTGLWGQNDIFEFGYINNNTLEVWTDNGLDLTPNPFPDGEWAHVAVVNTGSPGVVLLYTNGVLAMQRNSVLPANNSFGFNIGGGGVFDGTGNFFNGQIDEVAVYDKALSAEQIKAQYEAAFKGGSLENFVNIGGNKIGTLNDTGSGNITIVGGGHDIWDQGDEFAYNYTKVTGDFDVQVRVESLSPNARWSKAGLMARESISEFSRMAFARVTPPDVATSSGGNGANDTFLAYRTGLDNIGGVNGGQHEDRDGANPIPAPAYPNAWLRLVRSGSVISASNSADGVTWHYLSSQDTASWGGGAVANTLYVGLAVSRHSGNPSATAEFRNFKFNPQPFTVVSASSRGHPNAILVRYSQPPEANQLDPNSYTVTPPVVIDSVSPASIANSFWLNIGAGLTEGTSYEVSVFGPTAGGLDPVNGVATFVHGQGYEARAIHVIHSKTDNNGFYRGSDAVMKGIGDVVALGGGVYPGTEGNTVFEDPIPDNGSNERFSTRVSGVLNITTSGNYTFYHSSDDMGFTYLSSDENPLNKVQIANEPAWNGRREYINGGNQASRGTPPSNISTPKALVAGNKYYLEMLFTEGGGGNNGSVAWLPPGGPAVANGSEPIPAAAFLPTRLFEGQMFENLGPVVIVQNPASITVQALSPATFSAKIDGTPVYKYQWRRNGIPIPGATGPTYTLPTPLPGDDGARISVVVANEFSSATSAEAVLTVNNPVPPHLLTAAADASFTRVTVGFDNKLDPVSAQNKDNYTIAGLTVSAATLSGDRTVILTTSQQAEGTAYTLSVSNVRELTGINAIDPNPSTKVFYSLAFTPGFVTREFYTSFSGGNVDPFVAAYRAGTASPLWRCLTNEWEFNNADNADNYGGHILGYFVATESGPHTFFISSDDPGRLFLSTDASPANAVLIASEPTWNGRRDWTGTARRNAAAPENRSAPIELVAGQRYYMDSFFTEGGGGDNMAVAVRLPSDTADPVNGTLNLRGANLGGYFSPEGATLSIGQQPQDQTVLENASATFSVGATGSSPLCGGFLSYQWYRDGAPIKGATAATLSLPLVTSADNGAMFTVLVYVPGLKQLSSAARLSISTDTTAPTPVSAIGNGTFNAVTIAFDERLDVTTAQDAFNYSITPALNISGDGVLNADGRSVTFPTDPQTENTVYTINVKNVADLAGNAIDGTVGKDVTFRSFVASCAGVLFQTYNVNNRLGIDDLVNQPTYPNNPRETMTISGFDSRLAYADDSHEDYAGRLTGVFIPPVSGNWIFHMRSDDPGRLYFNPTGPSAAGKIQVGDQAGCCNAFPASGAQMSAPYPLVAGNAYYVELVFREFGGGDYGQVAVQLEGTAGPTVANLVGSLAGAGAAPAGVVGPINITQQPPATLQAVEQTTASVSVVASNPNGMPLCYQWQASVDGGATFVDIPGATSATLSRLVDASMDGLQVRVVIGVVGAKVTSSVTTLDVIVDTQAPLVVSAKGSDFFDTISVRFNELVDQTSAEDEFNYSVSGGLGVTDATLQADGMTVLLTLSSRMAEGQTYTVTINNVNDRAVTPNTIAPNTQVTFRSFVISCGFLNFASYKNIGGTAVSALTADPRFPNSPDERAYLSSFDTRTVYPTDALENYGGRISGYFVPPVSGDWILYLRSDDASQLFFDATGAGKVMVAEEPGCCRAFSAVFTAPLTLVAGEKYPIEVLYKEGGGGDYAQVAARLASDTTTPLSPIPATMIAAAADPTGASINITLQPVDVQHVIDTSNPTGAGSTLAAEDFNASNGGYTVENSGSPASPWSYNAASGTWSAYHTDPCGPAQNASRLISPSITVTRAGRLGIELTHRYSFEGDHWDGGQLRVSINGGPFVTVPASAFSEGGYNSTSLVGNHQLLAQAGWNGDSANYTSGANIISRAALGAANVGDTIRVQLLAAWDECTAGKNPSWVVDAVRLTEGAQDPTFRIAATGAIEGYSNFTPFIQWQRNDGAGWVAVPNGTGPNLLLNPTLADNGARFRAQVYVPGATVTSEEATLTVVQLNTPPRFDCGPGQVVAEDAGPQTVPEWAKNISVHSIVRVPTVFASAFDSLPEGSRLLDPNAATARPDPRVEDGILKLTDAGDPGGFGGWALGPFPTATYESLQASWKSRIGGGAGGGADGYSLNIGTDLADNFTGEEGTGTGLSVTVDTFDNGGGEVGVEIRWGGTALAFQAIPKDDDGSGNFLRKDTFVDANLSVDTTGLATFTYDGNTITAQLPNYTGIRANQINIGARTGGANDNHWIDDLNIAGFPFDASSAEAGQTVQFVVTTDSPSLFSLQPAVSPTGTLTYTPAPNACGVANITVVARDSGGVEFGGRDTSAECRFTITINGSDDPVVAVNQNVVLPACTATAIVLSATDPDDGTACGASGSLTYTIVTGPTKGTLSGTAPSLTYTPTVGGADSFSFRVTDGAGVSSIGVVSIQAPICTGNTPPVARMNLTPLADFSPDLINGLAISCNGSNVCLSADGSQSSDQETPNSGLRFDWLVNGVLVASGETATICLELGMAQVVTLVVTDPQGASGTASATIDAVSVGEALDELITKINESSVARSNKRPFIASLKAAVASADRGNAHTAQNQLNAFQNKVRAQISRNNPADAQTWIRWAQSISDALEACAQP